MWETIFPIALKTPEMVKIHAALTEIQQNHNIIPQRETQHHPTDLKQRFRLFHLIHMRHRR